MPVDTHLQWQEIRDFRGGLWTVNSQLIPPNGAQTMTDCFPAPSGGLKAWFKKTTFTTTGIGSVSGESPRMIFAHENVDGAGNNDYYLLTYKASDTKLRLYELNEQKGDVAWTQIKLFAAGLDPGVVNATAYNDSLGNLYMFFGIGAGGGADSGVWGATYAAGSTATVFKQSTVAMDFVFNYQSRICGVKGATIYFSDVGSIANMGTNTAPIDIDEGQPNIMFVATFSPGDLLVFKEGAPIYLVQGDLTNYTVRQMNGSKPVQIGGPNVVRGPMGVIFRVGTDGIYETPDGAMLNPLSKAISNRSWQSRAPIVWQNHWLLAMANGLVLDYDSKAWFTYSEITSGTGVAHKLPRLGGFMFTDNASSFTIGKVIPQDGRTDNRAESYTWKSSPIRDQTGRQMEIRCVQVYARSFNGSPATSTIAVTVNGVTQTLACDSSGRGGLTFYFLARKEELDIQVVAASNESGVCAPDIEVVRFAGQPGHFLRQVADVG